MSAARSLSGNALSRQGPGRKRIWLVLIVAALLVLLASTVDLRLWTAFDLTITQFLERLVPRSLDLWLSLFSLIGSAEVTGLFILAYALFVCAPALRVRFVVLFILIALLEWIGKTVINQPGPPGMYYHYMLPFSFPTASVETPFSFPSGHSARSVFVTIVLVVWIRQSRVGGRWKQALLGVVTVGEIIMLVSRVSLGEHWSTDVIGGALLATALALPWLFGLESTSFPRSSALSAQSGSTVGGAR